MDRRNFLQSAILAVSGLALDPERLLWTPGKKTIFIPAPHVCRSGACIASHFNVGDFVTFGSFPMVYRVQSVHEGLNVIPLEIPPRYQWSRGHIPEDAVRHVRRAD